MFRTLAAALTSWLLVSVASSQSPVQEGDLFIAVGDELYGFDPSTGNGTLLFDDLFLGFSTAGWLAFDSHRGGLLAYTSHVPLGVSVPRLFLVRPNAQFTDLGYAFENLKTLAPTGDGRVYLFRNGELSVLDALNQMSPVQDQNGQPVTLPLEHMLFDGPSNSLVGVTLRSLTGVPCAAPGAITIHRLPLNPSGTQLAAAPACSNHVTSATFPVALDPLPGGTILITVAGSSATGAELFELDPVSLSVLPWATSTLPALKGGVWSPPLGRTVVLDTLGNQLRTYAKGDSGAGQPLATNVPVSPSGRGVNATNLMVDVNFQGPICTGFVEAFGTGLAGLSGKIPAIGAAGCPTIGETLPLTVSNGRASATTVMVFSLQSIAVPLFGGTLYAKPKFFATRVLALDGLGFGQQDVPIPNDPTLIGLPFFAQAAVADSAAPQKWALTQGLEMRSQ